MLRKNTSGQALTFCLVNATTGAALTGATVTAKRCIDGAAQASATGTVTEPGNGQYLFAPSQADTNGDLIGYLFTATSAIPVNLHVRTTAADLSDAVRLGLTALPAVASGSAGAIPTTGTGPNQIAVDGSGGVNAAMGQALPAAPSANTVGEAHFLADVLGCWFGTAQAGTSTTITLDAGASALAGSYVGDGVYLYGGTGGGVRGVGQMRTITAYNTSTKVATVDRVWATTPDATTTFMILARPKTDVFVWQGTALASVATAGVPDANVKAINNVSAGSVTTVGANVGTTQPLNFTGTGASALVKGDAIDWNSVGVTGMPMPTYTQPSGFLAATFPTTVASTTNITSASGVSLAASQHVIVDSGTVTTVTNQLTAAQVATGVWQDATAGDFTTASSIGKSLYNAFTANSSVYTTAALANAPTGGSAPTTAQIATAVWQDLTSSSDFSTASSIGALLKADINAPIGSIPTNPYTGTPPTAAQVATAVWTDTTAGDFTAALSVGKSLMNGVSLGTGLTVANLTNAPAAGDFTATMKTSLNAATPASVTGAVGSVTAGVTLAASQHVVVDSGTVTTLTNLPAVPTDWLTAAGVKADAVTKIQSGLSTYAGADTAGTTTLLARLPGVVQPQTGDAYGFLTTALTESYAANGAAFTLAQALYEIASNIEMVSITGTTGTTYKRNGSTTATTFSLDSASTPTTRKRAT